MAEPQTVNCGLIVPNTGDLVGTWGSAALNPDWVAVDGYLGGVQTISVSNAPITLTAPAGFTPTPGGGPTQAQNAVIKLTGALTGSVAITLPLPGVYTFHNLTTNTSFPVLVLSGGATEIGLPPGGVTRVYNDGTNVYYVDLPQVGSFLDLCTTTIPAWIANSSPAPYLYCNGASFSAVTYPYLNGLLGGTTLPDLRGRSRFFFNDGTNRITSAGSGINGDALLSVGGNQNVTVAQANLPAATLAVSDTRTWQSTNVGDVATNTSATGTSYDAKTGPGTFPASIPITVVPVSGSISAQLGGSGTALNVMTPTQISGITLIRAG